MAQGYLARKIFKCVYLSLFINTKKKFKSDQKLRIKIFREKKGPIQSYLLPIFSF